MRSIFETIYLFKNTIRDQILQPFFGEFSCRFIFKIFVLLTIIVTAGYGVITFNGWHKIFCQIIIGFMLAHAVEIQHEVLHGLGISESLLNKFIGYILGLPMFVIYTDYKLSHMAHHKNLGTPADKEFFGYGNERLSSAGSILATLFMIDHYKLNLIKLYKSFANQSYFDYAPKRIARKIVQQYRFTAYLLVFITFISLIKQSYAIIDLWLIPLLFIGTPVHALIELPEHLYCDTNSTNVFRNTRTILTNKFITWFINGNNYHVEHHLNPRLQVSQLAEQHTKINDLIKYVNSSYFSFYMQLIKELIARPRNNTKK